MGYLRAHADRLAAATATPIPVSDGFRAQYPSWEEQFVALFIAGAVAIYLEDHVNKREADAYVLMAQKTQSYSILLDFLPVFPKQLRVAKRIVSL